LAQHCATFSGAQQAFFFVSIFMVVSLDYAFVRAFGFALLASFPWTFRAASQSGHFADAFAAWVLHVARQLERDCRRMPISVFVSSTVMSTSNLRDSP
jgi:hypothetical protein